MVCAQLVRMRNERACVRVWLWLWSLFGVPVRGRGHSPRHRVGCCARVQPRVWGNGAHARGRARARFA